MYPTSLAEVYSRGDGIGEVPAGINSVIGTRVFPKPGFFPKKENLKEVRQRGHIRAVVDKLRRGGKSVIIRPEIGRIVLFIRNRMPGDITSGREKNKRARKKRVKK